MSFLYRCIFLHVHVTPYDNEIHNVSRIISNTHFSTITDNVTCQTKCQVTINDINSNDNGLEKVVLGFGYEIYEYKPCKWIYVTHYLNMNIICPAWNKGKFIQANFK